MLPDVSGKTRKGPGQAEDMRTGARKKATETSSLNLGKEISSLPLKHFAKNIHNDNQMEGQQTEAQSPRDFLKLTAGNQAPFPFK